MKVKAKHTCFFDGALRPEGAEWETKVSRSDLPWWIESLEVKRGRPSKQDEHSEPQADSEE